MTERDVNFSSSLTKAVFVSPMAAEMREINFQKTPTFYPGKSEIDGLVFPAEQEPDDNGNGVIVLVSGALLVGIVASLVIARRAGGGRGRPNSRAIVSRPESQDNSGHQRQVPGGYKHPPTQLPGNQDDRLIQRGKRRAPRDQV